MKKQYYPLSLLALCLSTGLASLGISSCLNPSAGNTVTFDSTGITLDTVLANGNINYTASFDFPVDGPQPLVDSIFTYLAEVTNYSGTPENAPAMLQYAADTYLQEHKEWMDGNDMELDMNINAEHTQSQRIVYQNDKVLTYEEDFYAYEGGAHGTYSTTYTTFCKATGRRIGWDIIAPDKRDALRAELFDRIEKEIRTRTEDPTASLKELMFEEELDLPSSSPGFTAEGVKFTYVIYEIVPYVFGQQVVTFSYDEMKQYVLPEYADLLSAQ